MDGENVGETGRKPRAFERGGPGGPGRPRKGEKHLQALPAAKREALRSVLACLREGAAGDVDAARNMRDDTSFPPTVRADLAKTLLLHVAGHPHDARPPPVDASERPAGPPVSLAPPPLPEKTG